MPEKINLTDEENRVLRRILSRLLDLQSDIFEHSLPRRYNPFKNKEVRTGMSKKEIEEINSFLNMHNSQIKGYELFVDKVNILIGALKGSSKVVSNDFLFFTHFAKVFSESTKDNPQLVFKAFIKLCKRNNAKCSFLTCYDNDGELIPEMLYKIKKELDNMPFYSCESIISIGKLNHEEISNIILPPKKEKMIKEYLEEQNRIQAAIKEEKRIQEEKKKITPLEIPKELPLAEYNYERHSYDPYFNPQRQILKPSVVDNLTYEEFDKLLSNIPSVTKKQKNLYLELYKNYKTEAVIKKNYASLSMIQKQRLTVEEYEDLKEKEIFSLIKLLIFSDDYKSLSQVGQLEKLKETIDIYIDKNSDNRNKESSLLIFSDNDFITNLIDNLSEQRNGYEDADTLKKIKTQLEKLKHISIEELRAGKAFHPVMYGDDVIDLNGIKGYRFGDKTCKIFFFRLSVHNDNKIALQKRYNLADTPDVLLVYYVGDVKRIDEEKLYDDANSYFLYYSKIIENISDIFEYPFNSDTENMAYKLIDEGHNNLEKLTEASLDSQTDGFSR